MSETNPSADVISKVFKEIQDDKTTFLESLLKADPQLDWTKFHHEATGDTILHYAAHLGKMNVITFLLGKFEELKAVDCKDRDGKTALHTAAQSAQFEACKILIDYNADINAIKKSDWTPMMLACTKIVEDRNYKIVDLLLRYGAFINYKNKDGWTCVHLISRVGEADIFNLLVKHGADIYFKTNNGRTALHIAALHGHLQIVNRLLALGANPNDKDNVGNTPLHDAILGGAKDVVTTLISNRADKKARNNNDFGLLHLASSVNQLDVVKFLVEELKWDVNEKNENRMTPLNCAAKNKSNDVYEYLLRIEADVDALGSFKLKPNYVNKKTKK